MRRANWILIAAANAVALRGQANLLVQAHLKPHSFDFLTEWCGKCGMGASQFYNTGISCK